MNLNKYLLCVAGLSVPVFMFSQIVPTADLYGTGNWDADSLGNHRIVISVDKPCDAVLASVNWRRRDLNPQDKGLIVVDASTGERITNVCRYNISREKGDIVFQPKTAPGEYYIYYLKNVSSGSRYYPTVKYPPFENLADENWVKKNKLTGKTPPSLPKGKVVQYQAINDFNSFYPMEVIATAAEKAQLIKERADENYIIFTEDRKYPIRMTTDIPYKWIEDNRHDHFEGDADRGEYYVFQIGVLGVKDSIRDLNVDFSAFVNEKTGEKIPLSASTCFNTEGIDVTGTVVKKLCGVGKDKVQALWIGTQVPEQITPGVYRGKVTVSASNTESKTVDVALTVSSNLIANHGDDEPWRHSRLRWLNSQIGFDDEVISPYTAVKQNDKNLSILGRDFVISATGLPAEIKSYFEETVTTIGDKPLDILAAPMEFVADGGEWTNMDFAFTKRKPAAIAWKALNENGKFLMELEGELESDGNVTYNVTLIAKQDGSVKDIALKTLLNGAMSEYTMGLGQKGGFAPDNFRWKWDVEKNQDAIWLGKANAGMQIRLYDDKYERPLNTNFYHEKPLHMPTSWDNGGNGGIDIAKNGNITTVNAYSGNREMKKGDRLHYNFTLLITPFRTIDTDKHWHDRYFHGYDFIDKTYDFGANVVNIHHATAINPFINYPFLRVKEMKSYIDGAHARDMKVKIYNTVRELSNSCVEMFALRSLGDEIFSQGPGGGFSWLQEHLDQNYIGAWFVPQLKDAAIVNSGVSRWHNYYMEGLDWLVKNVGIDGLYIDDLAFDRMSMKRVRKILDRTNPSAMIDLHSANQYNDRDGYANSANLYLEHFPYLDRIWFGEYFDYDMPPEFWFVEVSGIPYGTMGEMLWNGGNKWRGMLYGITGRNPGYGVDNRPLWKFWDEFGMNGSEMIGYWVKDNPVKTNRDKTLATIYRHKGEKTLISVATWEDNDVKLKLDIDWEKLGLDPKKVKLTIPEIENFQSAATLSVSDEITVPQGKGLLIVAE